MTDVFISYKRDDRNYARKIAELLVERGYDVWWDIELLPGDKFADEINEILSNAKAAIVLWTPESIQSNWVKSEANIAFDRNILIPIRLRNTNIPAPFNTLHSLDLTSWEGTDSNVDLDIVIKAIDKKIGVSETTKKGLSAQEIDRALEGPRHEIEFWTSISNSTNPTIDEYVLYIETYGEQGSFTKLAQSRIRALKESSSKGLSLRDKLTLASILMGIAVGGFTIANTLGMFETGEKRQNTKVVEQVAEPEKIVLARYPKVVAITVSTWGGGGSHTENCVPPLTEKAGYVLVGGQLDPGIQHSERERVGCPPPGHCDGLHEYCTTIERSPACYVNQTWYDWKVKQLAKTTGDIDYQTICKP